MTRQDPLTRRTRLDRWLPQRLVALALGIVFCAGVTTLFSGCKPEKDNRPPEQLWKEVCATCHGQGGEGHAYKLGKRIDMRSEAWQRRISDEEIAKTIREGKRGMKRMPKFGDRLSEEQIEGLVEYIRTELPK